MSREEGGIVGGSGTFTVGEHGPETLVMHGAGSVMPIHSDSVFHAVSGTEVSVHREGDPCALCDREAKQ